MKFAKRICLSLKLKLLGVAILHSKFGFETSFITTPSEALFFILMLTISFVERVILLSYSSGSKFSPIGAIW